MMTCHNQRDMVLRSARRALTQGDSEIAVEVFLTDDGSADGTAEALSGLTGSIHVISGSGGLFWAAGMALAERSAWKTHPDYLLWLNADTVLDPGAVRRLVEVEGKWPGAIVIGATRDPESGQLTYGGRVRASRWHPQRLQRLPESDQIQLADTFNGNVVLVPRTARSLVGPIDGAFPHAYADDDYGLRAHDAGVTMVQAPGTVAQCSPNPEPARFQRGPSAWRALQQPKGLPWRAQIRYLRRHAGPGWPLVFAAQQASVLLGLRAVGVPGHSD